MTISRKIQKDSMYLTKLLLSISKERSIKITRGNQLMFETLNAAVAWLHSFCILFNFGVWVKLAYPIHILFLVFRK